MSVATKGELYRCVFQWKIENVSNFWWLKMGERIESPPFIADGLEGSKWSLILFPIGLGEEENVGLFLRRELDSSGPEIFQVNLQLALLGKDGSILKERTWRNRNFLNGNDWGASQLETHKRVFVTGKEAFIHEDTLLVQCTLWTADERSDASNLLFATTVVKVKRRSLVWKIEKNNALESESLSYEFKDYLIGFHAILNNLDKLCLDMTSFGDDIKYISCNTSVLNSEGKKENWGIKKYFADDLKKGPLSSMLVFPKKAMGHKSRYFLNDVLSLHFDFVISTLKHFNCSENSSKLTNREFEKIVSQNTSILLDDTKSLFEDGILSDTVLRTSNKSFLAHKNILSARSPVFNSIFSSNMNENNNGQVEITDFDDDTVHQMLVYTYTDSLDNMQFESACKLFAIAHKYRILSLINKCSYFLEENLCPTNACEVLVLAVEHNDNDLKRSVEDYILGQREQVFCKQEWEDFMNSQPETAADIMLKKIIKNKMHLKENL